jgi:hypothetical protein
MKLNEIRSNKINTDSMPLNEVAVNSSWIEDLEYDGDFGDVIMTLNSGRTYQISGVPEGMFEEWVMADSKGKFWHSDIVGHYRTTRI